MSNKKNVENLATRYSNVKDNIHLASYNRIKKEYKNLKNTDITNFLLGQASYTMFRNRKHKFLRRKILKKWAWETVSGDLADLQIFKRYNKKMAYILVMIDNYSNFVYLFPIENKGKDEMKRVLTEFLQKVPKNTVKYLHTDKGT